MAQTKAQPQGMTAEDIAAIATQAALAAVQALMGTAQVQPEAASKATGKGKGKGTKAAKAGRGHYANGLHTRTALKRAAARELFGKPFNALTDAQKGKALAKAKADFEAEHKAANAQVGTHESEALTDGEGNPVKGGPRKGTKANPYALKAHAVRYVKAHGKPAYYADAKTGKPVQCLPTKATK